MDEKIITVDISKSKFLRANPQWKYNYGQKLKFEGVQLPSYYQVHFSNSVNGEAKTQIGDSTGVEIPPEYFIPGQSIFAWIYVTDEDSGVTLRQVEIPIHKKALVTDQEITPHEQTVIDETIAALNNTIEDIPNQIAASLTEARDSGIFDGKDGSTIWVSEFAPVAPSYTFNISGLSGTPDSIVKQNDLILYSIGLYKIKSISDSTVLADFYVELKDLNALNKNGDEMFGNLNMGLHKIINVAAAQFDDDAVNLKQVKEIVSEGTTSFKGNFATKTALLAVNWQTTKPSGANYVNNNDFAIVQADETNNNECWRYVYIKNTGWVEQYRINEAPLTSAQMEAINSGITAEKVSEFNQVEGNVGAIEELETTDKSSIVAAINELNNNSKEYATESWVNDQGFLKEHQSLEAYRTAADQDVIDNKKISNPQWKPVGSVLTYDGTTWVANDSELVKVYSIAATTSDGSLLDVTGGPTLEEIKESVVHEVTPVIYVDFVQESSSHSDVIGHACLILQDWKFDGLDLVDATFSNDNYSYRIYMFAGRLIKTLMPVLPPVTEDEIAAYTIRATYDASTDTYTVTSAPTLAELWEAKHTNDKTIVITLNLDNGAEVFAGSDIQFGNMENDSPISCCVNLAPGDIGFYQLFGTSSAWQMRLVGFTDVTALNAPTTQGTAGQILSLDNNLSTVWVDQPGGELYVVNITSRAVPVSDGGGIPIFTWQWEFSATANEIAYAASHGKKVIGRRILSAASGSAIQEYSECLFGGIEDTNPVSVSFMRIASNATNDGAAIATYTATGDSNIATEEIVPLSGFFSLLVTFTHNNGVWSADKTFAEIEVAIDHGAYVYATLSGAGVYYSLVTFSSPGNVAFWSPDTSDNYLILFDDDTIYVDSDGYQSKSITDTGGYFTVDTVEGALQEIGAELSGINTLIGSGVIT